MPHSVFARLQPVSQWIVSDPAHHKRRFRMDPVLFLRNAAFVQSVESDGLEAIRNLQAYRRGYGSPEEVSDVTRDSTVDPN